jgi:hypothetical protein
MLKDLLRARLGRFVPRERSPRPLLGENWNKNVNGFNVSVIDPDDRKTVEKAADMMRSRSVFHFNDKIRFTSPYS